MITKTALAAWKRAFPWLSKEKQQLLATQVRKPLSEYNAGVKAGNDALAREQGTQILDHGQYPMLENQLRGMEGNVGNVADQMIGTTYMRSGKAMDTALQRAKDAGASTAEIQQLQNEIASVNLRRADPLIYQPSLPAGAPTSDAVNFNRNFTNRHELLEVKDLNRYETVTPDGLRRKYKNGVVSVTPRVLDAKGNDMFSHNTLNVLRDELKHVINSGYYDMHLRRNGILPIRSESGELGAVLDAGSLRENGAGLAMSDSSGNFVNGASKKAQKRFFKNLTNIQKKYDIKPTDANYEEYARRINAGETPTYTLSDANPDLLTPNWVLQRNLSTGTRWYKWLKPKQPVAASPTPPPPTGKNPISNFFGRIFNHSGK